MYPRGARAPGSSRCELAETFTIARGSQDTADVVEVELRHGGRLGLRRGGADRALRRVGRVGARVRRGASPARSATTRSRSRRSMARLPAERVRGAGGDRRRAARPRRASSLGAAGLAAARPARGSGRRPRGRSGSAIPTTWRAAPRQVARPLQAAEAEARRRATASTSSACAPCAAVDRRAAPGRRQRVRGRSTRRSTRCRSSPSSASSTASSRCPAGDPGGAELKRALAAPDLRRRGLPHARRRRRLRRARARDQHQAREVRRDPRGACAWRTRRARSGSA